MRPSARKDIAFILSLSGGVVLLALHFLSGFFESWWVFFGALVVAALLFLLAGLVAPPFWWGNRSFTTPLKDPSHEARQRDEI